MKEFFRKIVQQIRGIFKRKTSGPEDIIEKYNKVDVQTDWSSKEKLQYYLKNYAKDLLGYEDFSQFSLTLWEISESNQRPLLVMIMGEFKTGKSTFINAILGKEVLKSDVTPATAVVTMITYGDQENLVAHFQSGESKKYPIDMLDGLTAEGDEGKKALRSSLKYVELQLPLELLRGITLIDSPGLNVDNELHIKATKQFMHEADLVLWVFAYGKTASRTELASISELGERLKPIAIVNRIDEIDEEEESLEDVLAEIRKRLKSSVKDVFGVSSLLANQAMKEQNQELLDNSGWPLFSNMFHNEIVHQSDRLKESSFKTKTEEFVSLLKEHMGTLQKDLDYLHDKYNDKDKYESDINKKISILKNGIRKANKIMANKSSMDIEHIQKVLDEDVDGFSSTQSYLLGLKDMRNIILQLAHSNKILENIEMYDQIGQDTEATFKKWKMEAVKYLKKVELHSADIAAFDQDVADYNNSGFFGGRPLFDWDGRGKQLEQRQNRLNANLAELNSIQSNLLEKLSSLSSRIVRQNKELYKYISKLVKSIEKEIESCGQDLITVNYDYDENMRKLNKRYKELEHVQTLLYYLNSKVLKRKNTSNNKDHESA